MKIRSKTYKCNCCYKNNVFYKCKFFIIGETPIVFCSDDLCNLHLHYKGRLKQVTKKYYDKYVELQKLL